MIEMEDEVNFDQFIQLVHRYYFVSMFEAFKCDKYFLSCLLHPKDKINIHSLLHRQGESGHETEENIKEAFLVSWLILLAKTTFVWLVNLSSCGGKAEHNGPRGNSSEEHRRTIDSR